MRYCNAKEALSSELFEKLQNEAGGHLLYVPSCGEKRNWGELSGGRTRFAERNQQICEEYAAGKTVRELADDWFLSVDSIRKILSAERHRKAVHYFGLDIGGTYIKYGVTEKDGTLLSSGSVITPQTTDGLIEALCHEAELARQKDATIAAVGISCAGYIENGNEVTAHNLPLDHTPIRDLLEERIHLPVRVENDANCAALGEYVHMQTEQNLIYVAIGTGIGTGIILNGHLFKGHHGRAGEAGHMTLVYGGRPCPCGRLGCFEAYASVTALIAQTNEAAKANPGSLLAQMLNGASANGKTAFAAAKAGCPVAAGVLENYIGYLAAGLDSLYELFDPQAVILAGNITREGETLLQPLKDAMHAKVPVSIAENAGLSGVVGCTRLFTAGLGK